jgi:photosystem II stability/assembly factor-like uncharacterized protein
VIIGTLVSLSRPRLDARARAGWAHLIAAALVALLGCVTAVLAVRAGTLPDSTWVALPPLPQQGRVAVFALTVDPDNNQVLVAGNSQGSLLRSTDGGNTWTSVHTGNGAVLTVAFDSLKPGLVLAGSRGSGALASNDDGVTWTPVSGLDGRAVRVFGFALSMVAAGTDRGVYISQDGLTWTQSGLENTSIDALAVAAIHDPVRLVAGSDTVSAGGGVPLYQSTDAGATWAQLNAPISGALVTRLAAGPLPPTGDVRPLIVGTNAGIFASSDNGATFVAFSGGDLLPSTDYTQIAFVTDHHDRFYAASDGGGSNSGGLWWTGDAGAHFTSLSPPLLSVTALAVSNDEVPILYVATFRASDHVALMWAYRDTGTLTQGPVTTPTPIASGGRVTHTPAPGTPAVIRLLQSSQTPYVALGAVALIVILFAVVAHFRGRRG